MYLPAHRKGVSSYTSPLAGKVSILIPPRLVGEVFPCTSPACWEGLYTYTSPARWGGGPRLKGVVVGVLTSLLYSPLSRRWREARRDLFSSPALAGEVSAPMYLRLADGGGLPLRTPKKPLDREAGRVGSFGIARSITESAANGHSPGGLFFAGAKRQGHI